MSSPGRRPQRRLTLSDDHGSGSVSYAAVLTVVALLVVALGSTGLPATAERTLPALPSRGVRPASQGRARNWVRGPWIGSLAVISVLAYVGCGKGRRGAVPIASVTPSVLRVVRGGGAMVLCAVLCLGCSSDTTGAARDPSGTPATARPPALQGSLMQHNDIRRAVRRGLEAAGDPYTAGLTGEYSSMLREVSVPLPKTWRFFRFDTFPDPGASFQVAVETATGKVVYLTGEPTAFARVLRESGASPATERDAAELGRAFLDLTRPMDRYLRVIDGLDDLEWRPAENSGDARARTRAERRLRSVLRPPQATVKGGSYVVTAFVRYGTDIERRVVTITPPGSVTESREVLASGLPII